jgi:hypothetical protein
MLRTVVADKIVREFVAKCDPPVRHRFDQALWGIHVSFVELLEEAQITEDAAVFVESDGTALLVGEDVESGDWQVKDGGAVRKKDIEGSDSSLVLFEENLWVCRVTGKEKLHALTDVAMECEIMTRLAVAVCRRLLDFVCLWSTEDRVTGI